MRLYSSFGNIDSSQRRTFIKKYIYLYPAIVRTDALYVKRKNGNHYDVISVNSLFRALSCAIKLIFNISINT